ncbi:hypothetical protein GBA52_001537 [Prunus armeniaca]|nr:hypothetical protein GBA52_001537 [Prunus armeniaca]
MVYFDGSQSYTSMCQSNQRKSAQRFPIMCRSNHMTNHITRKTKTDIRILHPMTLDHEAAYIEDQSCKAKKRTN